MRNYTGKDILREAKILAQKEYHEYKTSVSGIIEIMTPAMQFEIDLDRVETLLPGIDIKAFKSLVRDLKKKAANNTKKEFIF